MDLPLVAREDQKKKKKKMAKLTREINLVPRDCSKHGPVPAEVRGRTVLNKALEGSMRFFFVFFFRISPRVYM